MNLQGFGKIIFAGTFVTSTNDEHRHFWWSNRDFTSRDDGHQHKIMDGKVEVVDGHTHKLLKTSVDNVDVEDYADKGKEEAEFANGQFSIQNHYRGRSVHGDFRYGIKDKSEGFTLLYKDVSADSPVTNVAEAKAMDKKLKTELNNNEGMDGRKILAKPKSSHALSWIAKEGVIPKGEAGGGENVEGVMSVLDKGSYTIGEDREDFKEFFLKGKKFTGRWMARKVKLNGKDNWLFWKPKDQVASKEKQ